MINKRKRKKYLIVGSWKVCTLVECSGPWQPRCLASWRAKYAGEGVSVLYVQTRQKTSRRSHSQVEIR